MEKLVSFVKKLKDLDADAMTLDDARRIVMEINNFLYANYPDIGTTEALGQKFPYFSDFHKFWEKYHKQILDCKISEDNCERVADALHDIFVLTNGEVFNQIYDTDGLSKEEICRVRILTANQDFRGSRAFSDFAEIYDSDPSIFDIHNIADDPDTFLKAIRVTNLSQNDKRLSYAKNIAKFLIEHGCDEPHDILSHYDNDISRLRAAMINYVGAGYGNKKTDMFLRDMIVLDVWSDVKNFERIDVASDVNTIKVALRTGILQTSIPLVSSFLDIFCHQYAYIDEMNAKAWRKVWDIWRKKYPSESIKGPCLIDYLVYNVIGKQFCKENLYIFKGSECNHTFRWHSASNRTCQVCFKNGKRGMRAHRVGQIMPCTDADGHIVIERAQFVKNLPNGQKIKACPFIDICSEKHKQLQPPSSISILGRTGWDTAYSQIGCGGGGLMA